MDGNYPGGPVKDLYPHHHQHANQYPPPDNSNNMMNYMKQNKVIVVIIILIIIFAIYWFCIKKPEGTASSATVNLTKPDIKGGLSIRRVN
jgi:predicted S18 family serine protease